VQLCCYIVDSMAAESKLNSRADRLIAAAEAFERKLGQLPRVGERLASPANSLGILLRMTIYWRRGEYRPRKASIFIAVAALSYFLNPIDLIPDFIPLFGWLDDVAIFVVIGLLLRGELRRFRQWEEVTGHSCLYRESAVQNTYPFSSRS